MKISTKGRYALRLMIDLAVNNTGAPVSLRDVADRQGISEKYLEQIIAMLNKAGMVRSVRGAGGGYLLSRKPEAYTAGDILRVTEGDLCPVDCVGANATPCDRMDKCVTIEVWKRLYDAVNRVLDGITLAELTEMYFSKGSDYVI